MRHDEVEPPIGLCRFHPALISAGCQIE